MKSIHKIYRNLLLPVVLLALVAITGTPAQAQNCPSRFDNAHFDLYVGVQGSIHGGAYFRHIGNGIYCRVGINATANQGWWQAKQYLVANSNGSFTQYRVQNDGSSRIVNAFDFGGACGTMNDPWHYQQTARCGNYWSYAGGYWESKGSVKGYIRR